MRSIGFASKMLRFFLGSAFVIVLMPATASAQGANAPIDPGPSVAGHWRGNAMPISSQVYYQQPWTVDLVLTQERNSVSGVLSVSPVGSVPRGAGKSVKGIEEGGKLNLTGDFNPVEHPRLRMTVVGETLVGELQNFHDQPSRWSSDSVRVFTLNKLP